MEARSLNSRPSGFPNDRSEEREEKHRRSSSYIAPENFIPDFTGRKKKTEIYKAYVDMIKIYPKEDVPEDSKKLLPWIIKEARRYGFNAHVRKPLQDYVNAIKRQNPYPHLEAAELKRDEELDIGDIKINKGFGETATNYRINTPYTHSLEGFINQVNPKIIQIQRQAINEYNKIKSYITVEGEFYRIIDVDDQKVEEEPKSHSFPPSKAKELTAGDELGLSQSERERLQEAVDTYVNRGSGWILKGFKAVIVSIRKYKPLMARGYIELPEWIKAKEAMINPLNDDEKCFMWCLLIWNHPEIRFNKNRVSQYKTFVDDFNFNRCRLPVHPYEKSKLKHFEQDNNLRLFIWSLTNDKKLIYKAYCSQLDNVEAPAVHLFYFTQGKKAHICYIKNLSRLLSKQINNHKGKIYLCSYCEKHFYIEKNLLEHQPDCTIINPDGIKEVFPKENYIVFKNYKNKLKMPFVIYCDFEANNEKIQKVNSYKYFIVSTFPEYDNFPLKIYRRQDSGRQDSGRQNEEEDVVVNFLNDILKEAEKLWEIMNDKKDIIMSDEEEKNWEQSWTCHICEKPIDPLDKDPKVIDHCHITGKYRGPAHNSCNLNYNYSKMKIPVIFHNLKGYDSHPIIRAIPKVPQITKLTGIIQDSEHLLTFSFNGLKFIDSFAFVNKSLDDWSTDMKKEDFKYIRKMCPDEEAFEMLTRKGVYPYDWMDDIKKFECKELPSKEHWYSKLNDTNITDKELAYAHKVWDKFECKNFGDYHDLYLKTDVLLLADVFEKFRKDCLSSYQLDPCHYIGTPGLGWDSCLKYTNARIRIMKDSSMLHLIEKNIRGGISMISNRYAEMTDNNSIKYYDMTNLYGYAMTFPLPYDGYAWNYENWDTNKIMNINLAKSYVKGIGYFFDVDLHLPVELHDYFCDYPPAPENREIKEEELSDHQKTVLKALDNKHKGKIKKLVTDLHDKKNYLVHYRLLQCYIRLGVKVTKVHNVIEFMEKLWMKPYVDNNTKMRTKCKDEGDDCGKDFFKLMNNSTYGKSIEDVRKHKRTALCTNKQYYDTCIKDPLYEYDILLDDNLAIVFRKKTKVLLSKPKIVGAAILDLSKMAMYEMWYNGIKKIDPKVKLLMTDTDSFIFSSTVLDIEEKMKQLGLYHKDKIGKMKDECKGNIIKKFIGLAPKLYHLQIQETEQNKKARIAKGGDENESQDKSIAKGLKKSFVKNNISCDDYEARLHDPYSVTKVSFYRLGSIRHENQLIEVKKNSLTAYDDKRLLLDKYTSVPYGYLGNETFMFP